MESYNGVSNPPGGRSSDIFNDDRNVVTPSPRKVKDYMKSHVFNGDSSDSSANVKRSPRVNDNTQDRLFGATDKLTPSSRRSVVNDTYRSNVFGNNDGNDAVTPRKKSPTIVNPITGDKLLLNGDYAGQTNGAVDVAKQNGYTNGHHYDSSPMENGLTRKVRAPPGGVSHGLW
jgi:hypothetical protein